VIFGVFGVCYRWRQAQDRSYKDEAIMKWPIPTNFTEVMSFVGATQYLQKFIASFAVVAAPFHAITTSGKRFQWGKNQ
jgi:hypothetical protein